MYPVQHTPMTQAKMQQQFNCFFIDFSSCGTFKIKMSNLTVRLCLIPAPQDNENDAQMAHNKYLLIADRDQGGGGVMPKYEATCDPYTHV